MSRRGPSGGRPAKPIEQHKLDGTFRKDRHGTPPSPLSLQKPRIARLPSKRDTKKWIRSEADERAVANGCRFSERMATYVVEWIEKYLRCSEGPWAGKPFKLMDWQLDELIYPVFGWLRKQPDPPFAGRIVRRIRNIYVEIPKKNGKSPTGAMFGVYMWCGDGEQGGKVFSVATDIKQACIVHDHALNMIEDSPEIKALSKINHTTHRAVFMPTRSLYGVHSQEQGGDKRGEGLNANAIIADELHVWRGDGLYRTLRYASQTRPEPLFFKITTAGQDMDSVCRQQHDYAKGVMDGSIQDDRFLGIIYAAEPDDDWTDEDVWEKTNPAWGVLFPASEMRANFQEVKKSPAGIGSFKRYMLNIWATTELAWLDMQKWATCEEAFAESDLLGQVCYAGLDLSKSLDMTSLALVFPQGDGTYRQLVYFWMPEDTVADRRHLASYEVWRDSGHLEVTPGGSCDYDYVRERIVSIASMFDLKELAYDNMFAGYFTQQLEDQHGIHRVEFPQTIVQFAEPTSEYERLVTEGALRHNGNPVLTWQAGHTMIKEDLNKNIRPVKRKRGDYRTVDGIVGGIMALSGAIAEVDRASVYEGRGLLTL